MIKKPLLPVGFYDLLFDEAEESYKNVNAVLGEFLQKNYRLIKTPLVEFEDGFSNAQMANSFRTSDVISGKNLVFRNDITLQISRLLSSRLITEKLPLKLCYVGDVLCAKSEDLYVDRQQTQVGVEIIGCEEEKSDFEIIEVSLNALQKLQLQNLLIDFSFPNFLDIFLDEIKIENKEELRKAIMKKNLSEIRNLAKENAEIISKIAFSNDSLEKLSLEITAKINSPKISNELKRAQKIAEFIAQKFPQITTRFDLFGDQDSSYHLGLMFDIFVGDFSYPIAKGGRYKIARGDEALDAIGSTIYINRLRKL